MKRCPQCYAVYENTEAYCEADGQRLLDDPALLVQNKNLVFDAPASSANIAAVATGLIGVLTGVILCGAGYLAYSFLSSASDQPERERVPVAAQVHEPQTQAAIVRVPDAVPSPSETPAEEKEPQPSPEPSQAPAEPVQAQLNHGPVSTADQSSVTADGAKVTTIIEMQDGSKVEVDAAWKDNQGVWYRQGSLVSFVEGPRVKAITARVEPKTSPAVKQ
jgi:hypothetical protein